MRDTARTKNQPKETDECKQPNGSAKSIPNSLARLISRKFWTLEQSLKGGPDSRCCRLSARCWVSSVGESGPDGLIDVKSCRDARNNEITLEKGGVFLTVCHVVPAVLVERCGLAIGVHSARAMLCINANWVRWNRPVKITFTNLGRGRSLSCSQVLPKNTRKKSVSPVCLSRHTAIKPQDEGSSRWICPRSKEPEPLKQRWTNREISVRLNGIEICDSRMTG